MKILVINAGSSSLKYQFIDIDSKEVIAKGQCERIGINGSVLKHTPMGRDTVVKEAEMPTHTQAIEMVLDALCCEDCGVIKSLDEISAVGHRVVHGGEFFKGSVIIDDSVKAAIKECFDLAPLHNPANLIGIEACEAAMGKNVPQVAVFDTAFHQTMPNYAYMYALPYEYYEDFKVRRYGFHGTSHKYVASRAAEILGKPVEELKIITAHLGNGSSIAAVDGGKSVDTSMGFTPLAGLIMGTRSGDLDPAIIPYLKDKCDMTAEQVIDVLNKKSGVLGISGISSDFRDLMSAADNGNKRAQLAVSMFTYHVRSYIAAYAAAMGGVDAVVFTAGIGENTKEIRRDCVKGLEYMGVKLDEEKNNCRGIERDISADGAKVKILVIPTNEELMIATDTKNLIEK